MLGERTSSGRFGPLSAPRPPAPTSAAAQAFSVKSAHRSAPAHPIFYPICSVFGSDHAPLTMLCWRYLHSFRHSPGIGQTDRRTDRIGKISRSACTGML